MHISCPPTKVVENTKSGSDLWQKFKAKKCLLLRSILNSHGKKESNTPKKRKTADGEILSSPVANTTTTTTTSLSPGSSETQSPPQSIPNSPSQQVPSNKKIKRRLFHGNICQSCNVAKATNPEEIYIFNITADIKYRTTMVLQRLTVLKCRKMIAELLVIETESFDFICQRAAIPFGQENILHVHDIMEDSTISIRMHHTPIPMVSDPLEQLAKKYGGQVNVVKTLPTQILIGDSPCFLAKYETILTFVFHTQEEEKQFVKEANEKGLLK